MIHIGKNTKSTIISKGISAGKSQFLNFITIPCYTHYEK